jgi:hypothetical protein
MFLPKRERLLEAELMKRFWELYEEARVRREELIKERIAAGYNEHGFWRTYSYPGGIMGQVEHKYGRVQNMIASKTPIELLEDPVFLDNLLDLSNYASLFAAEVLLLREEERMTL